jgi:hypothetical protein
LWVGQQVAERFAEVCREVKIIVSFVGKRITSLRGRGERRHRGFAAQPARIRHHRLREEPRLPAAGRCADGPAKWRSATHTVSCPTTTRTCRR